MQEFEIPKTLGEKKKELVDLGYQDLGWQNDGINIPKSNWIQRHSSCSGNMCLFQSEELESFYCVDMS